MKSTNAKERRLNSFSKEVLVEFLRERWIYPDIKRLTEIERSMEIQAIQNKVTALLEKQRGIKAAYQLHDYLKISKQVDRLWKRQDKLFASCRIDSNPPPSSSPATRGRKEVGAGTAKPGTAGTIGTTSSVEEA